MGPERRNNPLFDVEKCKGELAAPFSRIAQDLAIAPDEYRQILRDFYGQRHIRTDLKEAMRAVEHPPRIVGSGYPIGEIKDYRNYELVLFSECFTNCLADQAASRIGDATINPLGYAPYQIRQSLGEMVIDSRQAEIAAALDPHEFEDASREAHVGMIKELGWEDDLLGHLPLINKFIRSDLVLTERYLPVAVQQLGWDYHFPYTMSELQTMFGRTGRDVETENAFSSFIAPLIYDNIEQELSSKLEEVEEKYGEDTAYLLEEMFNGREFDRILNEFTNSDPQHP